MAQQDDFVPDKSTAPATDDFVPDTAVSQVAPTTTARVPFFGGEVKINPQAQPGEWRMRAAQGGGTPGMAEEWTRAGLTLPINILAGMKAGGAGFKGATTNEAVTASNARAAQMLERTGRHPDAPRPQPTPAVPPSAGGGLGSVGTRGVGGIGLDAAEFIPVIGRIIKAARMGQKLIPAKTQPGQPAVPVDMSAPAMGGGPVPPGLTSGPVVPGGQVGPAFQPATPGMAQPRPDAVRPPPAWQQPKAVQITGDTGPTGASAGSSGAGPLPRTTAAQAPSGAQDLQLAREHRPAPVRDWPARQPDVTPTPAAITPPPAQMPGPSGTAGVVAKDSMLQSALDVAQQAKNQHNKGFKHGGKIK